MQQTPNLNLNKPDGTDVVDIAVLNANMDIIDGKLGTTGHNHSGTAGNGPKITSTGLAAGAADDAAIGNRTITDTVAAASGAGTITNLLSKIGYMIKSITGKANWYMAPVKTIEQLNSEKAPLANPVFTGIPIAPTPAAGTNTTQLANTAFVATAIANLIASSPAALDTLNELAAALGDDPNFATTMTNTLATKAPLASPALTGAPTAPTAVAGTNTTQIATTAFVQTAVGAASTGIRGFSNLKILVTGNSAATITADAISLLNAPKNQYIASNVSLNLNTATSGANGRDTGALAALTWYYLYAIYNPNTSITACLMSTSSTVPTLPSGYTYFARIGAVRTDGSGNLFRTIQKGRRVQFVVTPSTNTDNLPQMTSGLQGSLSTPTYVAISTAGFVPPTAASINLSVFYSNCTVVINPNNNYTEIFNANTPACPPLFQATAVNGVWAHTPLEMMLENEYVYNIAGNSGVYVLFCTGWEDNL